MTEDQIIEDQDVELHDDDNEVVEEAMAHDPKNAEAQSVASVDKAGDATGTAKKRKGDKGNKDPMQKLPGTKAGMMNAAYNHMSSMNKEDLKVALGKLIGESVDEDGQVIEAAADINYEADFSEDLNAIMANEATLSEEFKEKTAVIFEAAIKSKLAEEVDRLEEKYNEELEAEINSTKSDLVEKVDSYLNYVVENWMEENKVAIQTGLRTEIAEEFMNNLKNLFTESYIEVPESKVDLVDELAGQVEELEESLNKQTGDTIKLAEELETYKRDAIIAEAARGMAETQVEKLRGLVENVDFEDAESFASKVATIKESFFKAERTEVAEEVTAEEADTEVQVSSVMEQYIQSIRKTAK